MVKKLLSLVCALAMVLSLTVTAFAEDAPYGHDGYWTDPDTGYKYFYREGDTVKNQGFIDDEGKAYYADGNGIVLTLDDVGGPGWYAIEEYSSNEKFYYYNTDGTIAIDETKEIGGKKYRFDSFGKMETGTFWDYEAQAYYVTDTDGAIVTRPGWYEYIDKWYSSEYFWTYINEDGTLVDGLTDIGGKDYCFIYGKMQTLLFEVYDYELEEYKYYLADNDGELIKETGWYELSDEWDDKYWYYIKDDGSPAVSEMYEIDEELYYFDWEGHMVIGSFTIYDYELEDDVRMVADENGVVQTTPGWVKVKLSKTYTVWYYIKDDGTVVADEIIEIDGYDYRFDYDGMLSIGVFNDNGQHRVTNKDGQIQYTPNTWHSAISYDGFEEWYYVKNADGDLCQDEIYDIKGKKYMFSYDGVMQIGLCYFIGDYSTYYFADASGALCNNGWIQENFDWYYANADYTLKSNEWMGNYWFDEVGIMATGNTYTDDEWGLCTFDASGLYKGQIGKKIGWQKADGIWYYYDDIDVPHIGWLKSGGKYYFFNNDGEMMTNSSFKPIWYIDSDDINSYYVDKTGVMATGWAQDPYGNWMYADKNGVLANGWKKVGGTWYYFDECTMNDEEIHYIHEENTWHKFSSSGAWVGELADKKWVQDSDGYWYYITQGKTIYDNYTIKGKTYYFEHNIMLANDYTYLGKTGYVWLDSDGNVDKGTGWRQSKYGAWYYLEKGQLANGLKKIGNTWYNFDPYMSIGYQSYYDDTTQSYENGFFGSSGAWQKVGTGWYSATENGNTYWYYFKNGKPIDYVGNSVDNWYTIGGKKYMFDNGDLVTGVYYDGWDGYYIFDENGNLIKNKWIKIDDNWYYADASGKGLVGEHKISGKTYYFDIDGMML